MMNPVRGELNMSIYADASHIGSGSLSIHIYNMSGQLKGKEHLFVEPGWNEICIPVNEFTDGLYFTTVYLNGAILHSGKIVLSGS